MITNIKANPIYWNKPLYIASLISITTDDDDNEIATYSEPVKYEFNYQSVNSDAELTEFGVKASAMKKMVIPISYKDVFKEFDVAYLDGATPTDEGVNGTNANYKLLPPRNGNSAIIIYFERLTGK